MARQDDIMTIVTTWLSNNKDLLKKYSKISLLVFLATGVILVGFFAILTAIIYWEINLIWGELRIGALSRLSISFMASVMIILIVIFQIIGALLRGAALVQIGKILKAISSVLSIWLLGILLPGLAYALVRSYYFSPFSGATFIFISLLLALWASDKAVQVYIPHTNKRWGHAIIILLFLIIYILPITNYLRNDYYSVESGNTRVFATPSTGKIWHNKPDYIKHDPSTGELLIKATDEMIAQDRARRDWRNWFGKKNKSKKEAETVWYEVYRQSFAGVGYTGGDFPEYNDGGIKTLVMGKDVFPGYRYTSIDTDFEVWREGGWKKYPKGTWIVVNQIQAGKHISFRNAKGVNYMIVVQKR